MARAPSLLQFPPVEEAAIEHIREMIRRGFISFDDPSFSTLRARLARFAHVGDVAVEHATMSFGEDSYLVLADWLQDPATCRDLMDPRYGYIGVASLKVARETYWIVVLASR